MWLIRKNACFKIVEFDKCGDEITIKLADGSNYSMNSSKYTQDQIFDFLLEGIKSGTGYVELDSSWEFSFMCPPGC